MVRGTNVDGYNRVPIWLDNDVVTVSAAQLGEVDPGISYEDLKRDVDAAYEHKSYAYRGQRLEELDRFIRRMRAGDLVVTPMQGGVYLGEITSGIVSTRGTDWRVSCIAGGGATTARPLTRASFGRRCPRCCRARRRGGPHRGLRPARCTGSEGARRAAPPVRSVEKEQRTLAFNPVTAQCAEDLLIEEGRATEDR